MGSDKQEHMLQSRSAHGRGLEIRRNDDSPNDKLSVSAKEKSET